MEKEKLNELKKKYESLAKQTEEFIKTDCKELTEDEIKEVVGGDPCTDIRKRLATKFGAMFFPGALYSEMGS